MKPAAFDDRRTLAALGGVAFAAADVSHEALGHGLATLAVGGKLVLLTTCYVDSSGAYSKWIPAAGGLANLVMGLGSLAALHMFSRLDARLRYFLLLAAAFNLFFAFGYPAYSGIARFGDWSAVISGWEPNWVWRMLLIVVAVGGYGGSMKLLAKAIAPFAGSAILMLPDKVRLRRITSIPYGAALVVACLAGAMNPKGLPTMLTAGFPAAAAAFGLTQLHHLVRSGTTEGSRDVGKPMQLSFSWMMAAAFVLFFFVTALGSGVRFSL